MRRIDGQRGKEMGTIRTILVNGEMYVFLCFAFQISAAIAMIIIAMVSCDQNTQAAMIFGGSMWLLLHSCFMVGFLRSACNQAHATP